MSKVLLPIAEGSEEIEAVCIADVLRRAGAEVTIASVDALQITASRGVRIAADCAIEACAGADYDLIALPGGKLGAERLRDSKTLEQILRRQAASGRWLAAICAAPAVVLQHHGLLEGRRSTAHPGFSDKLTNPADPNHRVVIDGPVITSRGPGTALEFALACVAVLFGEEKARAVAEPMLEPWPLPAVLRA